MSAVRVVISMAVAGAVLLGGARMGGAFADGSDTAYRSGEPAGPGEIPVGDDLEVAGQPMQLWLFYTADPPHQVAQFYADAFRARGLLPVLASDPELAHVSSFDPVSGRQRFVTAIPQPLETLVLIGSTDPRHPPRFTRGPEGSSIPVPPEHRAFVGFRSADGSLRAESAQFVSALDPRAVTAFYRRALSAQGFEERRESSESLLAFARRGATVSIALQRLEQRRGAAVFATRIEGDGR